MPNHVTFASEQQRYWNIFSVDVLCMLYRPEAFMFARPLADGQFVSGKTDNNSSYSSSGGKRNDEQWGGGGSHFPVIHAPVHPYFHSSYP